MAMFILKTKTNQTFNSNLLDAKETLDLAKKIDNASAQDAIKRKNVTTKD